MALYIVSNEEEVILLEIVGHLKSTLSSIRCRKMTHYLETLGFEVRDGKKQGHKVFVHHRIATFSSGAYTCGHGNNPEIKPAYIRKVIRLLEQYRAELIRYLGETK